MSSDDLTTHAGEEDAITTTFYAQSEPPRDTLSVKEVAQLAGVSPQAVRKALSEGRLTGYRLDGEPWLVSSSEAAAWVEGAGQSRARNERASTGGTSEQVSQENLAGAFKHLLAAHKELVSTLENLIKESG